MGTIESLLDQLREALKEELRAEVRAEIISELSGSIGKAPKAKAKPGPKPKASPSATPKSATLKVKAGVRRTQEDIEQAAHVVSIWFKSNPGSRIDQAAAALKVPVKDLQRPVQWLLENKKLTKKGKLRGTKYTVKG